MTAADVGELSPLKRAIVEIRQLRARLAASEQRGHEPIAIVGMGLRFPGGADDPASFWRLLVDGVDAIGEVPPERWDATALYAADPDTPGHMTTRWGGFLDAIDGFDADFFGISPSRGREPRSAAAPVAGGHLGGAGARRDPGRPTLRHRRGRVRRHRQQRLHAPAAGRSRPHRHVHDDRQRAQHRRRPIGVRARHARAGPRDRHRVLVVARGAAPAARSLRDGECDLALAGGVNLILTPELTINFSRARMMAADGRCKTFDAAADGYVRSEGCAMVVLKRLGDAIAAGDDVLAVVRGSAVNQDGRSGGLTAPNGPSQEDVVAAALADAGAGPADVAYVEAHGTGTLLGDPIEIGALGAALCRGRSADAPLLVGSVKTNIGHTEAAAGIAGVVKAVLVLQHGIVPPHLHLAELNPHIAAAGLPLAVPTVATSLPGTVGERLVGVSSFGLSGTNGHVVIGDAPAIVPAATR